MKHDQIFQPLPYQLAQANAGAPPADDSDLDLETSAGLREYAKRMEARAKAAESQLAASSVAQRKVAFAEAGLDIKNPTVAFAAQHYDGELSAEKITEFAQGIGITAGAATPPPAETETGTPPATASDPGQLRSELAGDPTPPGVTPPADPMQAAWDERQTILQRGGTIDEAAVPIFGTMIAEARKGNPQFVMDNDAYQAPATEERRQNNGLLQ